MKNTTHLSLRKPDGTDVVDIEVINGNMDTIDTGYKGLDDRVSSLESGMGDINLDWDNITGKPPTFPPSTHKHTMSDITNGQSIWESVNINDYTTNGIWYLSNANGHTNAPPNLKYFSLRVEKYGQDRENYIRQTAQEILTQEMYTRTWRGSGNGWTEWKAVDAKTLSGKDLNYFVPKHNATLTGTTKTNQLMVLNDVEIRYSPFPNYVYNSTFNYGLKGWGYKQGNGTWGTNHYPLVGNSATCQGGATGLTYLDGRENPFNLSADMPVYLSFFANTEKNTSGRILVELIDASTHNKVVDVTITNNTGWTYYSKRITLSKGGGYYVRLVVNDNNERVHFSKIKVSHYGFSLWSENELDRMKFGGGGVKSIQRGVVSISDSQNEKTVSISNVDVNKTIVILDGDYPTSSSASRSAYLVSLSSTSFVIGNSYLINSTSTAKISWQVVEYL